MMFQELNNDQRREMVNARQRFDVWTRAKDERARYKGSMVWNEDKGKEYLVRADYDPKSGVRRQRSLGPRNADTEKAKIDFERGRQQAKDRFAEAKSLLDRQAAINRAVGIGRVPETGARIVRALDDAGLLGRGIMIVGTNSIYAYEAAAGVVVEASITATGDIDLLFDARRELRFTSATEVPERSIMAILRRVDRSFERDRRTFSAVNRDGFVVDFIKPMADPTWAEDRETIGNANDPIAVAIEVLCWLENAPAFEAVAIDERGMPLRIVAPDPRAFAVHKLWLSTQAGRDPVKRRRDEAQASVVARLVSDYLGHLPYEPAELTALPRDLFDQAEYLFRPDPT